jgi:AraC-like DNA-binding protein
MRRLLSIGLIPDEVTRFPEHQHLLWEIVYYTHGMGVMKIGREEIAFQPGDIVCQPPDISHSEFSKSGFRNIHFTVGHFDPIVEGILQFRDNENNDFLNILMQLYKVFHVREKNWEKLSESLLEVLYQYMLSWSSGKVKNPYVEKLESILVSNLSNRNFKLHEQVRAIPLSEDHLRKLFREETGRTPLEYLTDRRIIYAKRLLANKYVSLMTVKEIAGLVGYDDPYYFSRLFKRAAGKCPTEWIEENVSGEGSLAQ